MKSLKMNIWIKNICRKVLSGNFDKGFVQKSMKYPDEIVVK